MHELADMVKEVNALRSDAIFFTGDIVNSRADEMDGWSNCSGHSTPKRNCPFWATMIMAIMSTGPTKPPKKETRTR